MDSCNQIAPEHLYIDGVPEARVKKVIPKEEPEASTITLPLGVTLQELEKKLIVETLAMQRQNRTRTAETLGISIRTLRNKLNEYNIKPD